ncbi:MAG: asparagine synthase (glutamine-hydrolyzing) [Candidatus Portnoybacteria bacterium]|nr:asparagine synthase (glutamine-hydrolyzing) [Candidatus Portnoybacteria bacterium]
MCGILGGYNIKDNSLLDKVDPIIKHRGPDDFGKLKHQDFFLWHWRLSIIDLEGGRQPIFNEDKTLAIIFNGEIYNFKQLEKELLSCGHKFYTKTDTEVIIHAFEEYGENCLQKLEGMFAFAILDLKNNSLFITRDHLGIKPLYYYFDATKKEFLFASELKAILQLESANKELDLANLWEHLMFRYSPAPNTIVKNIKKLEPGHYLIFKNGAIEIKKYWQPEFSEKYASFEELKEQLKNQLRQSIQNHLIADVPVGIMLSGGIDSSALVAFAAERISHIKTFTIGFEGQKDNEFESARVIAKKFNSDHNELLIKPQNIDILPEVIWSNDEPVAGPSSLAYYLMFKEVKKQVKVLLLGHGADEIFCGYEQFKIQEIARKILGNPISYSLATFCGGLLNSAFKNDSAFKRLEAYLKSFKNDAANYFQLTSVFNFRELDKLIRPAVLRPHYQENIFLTPDVVAAHFKNNRSYWNNLLSFEMSGWLSDDLLHRADRITMSQSIEGRVPFLDKRLVELAAKIPFRFKLNGLKDKHIFRQTMNEFLPREISQKKKQRFNTPIHKFFSSQYDNLCRNLFSEKNWLNENIFEQKELIKLLDFKKVPSYRYILKHNKLSAQFYARQIWNIVVLEIWYKMFFEQKSIAELKNYIND